MTSWRPSLSAACRRRTPRSSRRSSSRRAAVSGLHRILKGETGWPADAADRDILYFLSQSFRAHLIKELPSDLEAVGPQHKQLAHRAKALLKDLSAISLEMAQLVVAEEDAERRDGGSGGALPGWLLVEVVRDLPRLVEKRAS